MIVSCYYSYSICFNFYCNGMLLRIVESRTVYAIVMQACTYDKEHNTRQIFREYTYQDKGW